jgi:hypothetical protein
MPRLVVDVNWQIEGPFLVGSGDVHGGLDIAFHRAAGRLLSVPKSHVKGKLLEAVRHLAGLYDLGKALSWWLGSEEPTGYSPERVYVSALRPKKEGGDWTTGPKGREYFPGHNRGKDRAARTAIGDDGTALDGSLRTEEIQPHGLKLWWEGRLETADSNLDVLKNLAIVLCQAGRLIEAFGSDKNVGYGVVRDFQASAKVDGQPVTLGQINEETCAKLKQVPAEWQAKAIPDGLKGVVAGGKVVAKPLGITPSEPVFVAGVKLPGSNFESGLDFVPGSAVKGALAAAMNLAVGAPLGEPIHQDREELLSLWPDLSKHFSQLRFLHAYPGQADGQSVRRAFRVPLSAYAKGKSANDGVWDAALTGPHVKLPSFSSDCERLAAFTTDAEGPFAVREVARTLVMRTQIDTNWLRAQDERLFGYQEIAEFDPDGKPPLFVTQAYVPDDGQGLADRTWKQTQSLLEVMRLGKTNAASSVSYGPVSASPIAKRIEAFGDWPLVITVNSDSLVWFSADDLNKVTSDFGMRELYEKYWRAALSTLGHETNGDLLRDVFAAQQLRGGWVGQRGGKGYRTFYLTLAGSVFVTNIRASDAAKDKKLMAALGLLEERGLPIPTEAGLDWTNCLFVPENGYGEVTVCHPWHVKRIHSKNGGV